MTKYLMLVSIFLAGFAMAQETPSSNGQQLKPHEAPAADAAPAIASHAKEQGEESVQEADAGSPPATSVFRNGKEKLSYALGVNLATGLKWQQISVDPEMVIKGFADAMSEDEKLLISAKELAETLKSFQQDRMRGIEHARQMLSDKNKKETLDFVAQNARKEGVVTLPSGLQYKILKPSDGKRPALTDTVVCNYRATLLDGKEFDSSYKRNEPATVPVKGLIKGWTEALQLMPVGSKWQIFIPPQLGYGEKVVGDIGPNSTLVFEIELLSIRDASQKKDGKLKHVASTPQGN